VQIIYSPVNRTDFVMFLKSRRRWPMNKGYADELLSIDGRRIAYVVGEPLG
jgi:hypothetical protein